MAIADRPTRPDGHVLAAISTEIVRIVAGVSGRGPTKARTSVHGNTVVCTLREVFTRPELAMLAQSRLDAVREYRAALHKLMRNELESVVERYLERRVAATLMDLHHDPDLIVLVFVLDTDGH
jgi:uncharacterized protein YbcI